MTCFRPLKCWPPAHPGADRKVVFDSTASYVGAVPFQIPCGRCIGCRLSKARDWSTRMHHEAKMHRDNCFITLTYDDAHLPEDGSLSVRAVQLFFKRFRKECGRLRYFAAGEYGEKLWRPHYHAIIFGYNFPDLELHAVSPAGSSVYVSATLQRLWPYGYSSVGVVNHLSAGYVARYCMKKVGGDQAASHYVRPHPVTGQFFRVIPEFAVMSRRPGIGSSWYDNWSGDAFPSDFVVIDGSRRRVPRFYRNKLVGIDSLRVLQDRKEAARKDAANATPERLSVREESQTLRVRQLKRALDGS